MNPLRNLTLTDEERERARRISRIAGKAPDEALAALLPQLDDPSWGVRRAVVSSLAALGDAAVASLCELLETRRDNEARLAAAVDALVASKGRVDDAVIALLDAPPAIACDAAQVLGRRHSKAGVPKLAALTKHENDNVALAAIEALGRINDESALFPIIAAVESKNFFRTFPAIDVLGRSGSPLAVRPLLAMLGESHYAIEAARALGRVGDRATTPALAALLARPNDALVRVAAVAICEIEDRHVARFGAGAPRGPLLGPGDSAAASRRLTQCIGQADAAERASIGRVLGRIGDDVSVSALLDMLNGDPATTEVAAATLAKLGSAAEPRLIEALQHGDSEQRLLLIPLFGHRRAAAAPIVECLDDPHPNVRAAACDALARIGESGVAPRLFTLLADPDARVVQSAIGAIQSLGRAETEGLALDAARSTNARVRRAGIRIVAYFGYASAVELLIGAMSDPDERIRDAAMFGLPYVEDPRAVAALVEASSHSSARTRAAAMRALGQTSRALRTIEALRVGLYDADAWVRYFACQSLSRLRDDESAERITTLLDDPAGQVHVAAIEALALLRGERALDALHRAAVGDDADVRRAALLGLGTVKSAASLPILRDALRSTDVATRLVALSALAEYDLPAATRDLGSALGDSDDGVRSAATALLASRRGPEATHALLSHLGPGPAQERLVAALAQNVEGRVELLAAALRTGAGDSAELVVSALVRCHRPDADQALLNAFTSPDATVRRAVASALSAMGSADARAALVRAATEDADDEVRHLATAATATG